jgi:3-hydroxyisobutyrate dehydrogenase-like beta-hydroxyacid dehydrogenase
VTIGLLHPGEMGAAIGAELRRAGRPVLWASEARSRETAARARASGLEDAVSVEELVRRSDVVLSVCPPHAAVETARSLPAFGGIYVDANAVSRATALTVAAHVERYVDGGIVGSPPREPGNASLYLSGIEAPAVAGLFAGTIVRTVVLSPRPGDASGLKLAYAAWTKGTAALLLAIRALARAEGVEDALLAEWRTSIPELLERFRPAASSALGKGWRWVAEMEEIADSFAAAGLPDGFHRAAAEVYRRTPHAEGDDVEVVLAALLGAR